MQPSYLQIVSTYAPAWGYGGPARIMHGYATGLSSRVDVHVICGDIDHLGGRVGPGFDEHQPYGIERVRILSRRLSARNINVPSPRMAVRALRHILSRKRVVWIHLAEFRGIPPLLALALKCLFPKRVRIVQSAFGMLHEKQSRIRAAYDALFMRAFLRNLDAGLAQNDHEMDCYADLMRDHGVTGRDDRIKLLPLHVDPPLLPEAWFTREGQKSRRAQAAIRAELGLNAKARVFLFLGRFHPEKGIVRALDVFAAYKTSTADADAVFVIAGREEGALADIRRHVSELGLDGSVRIVEGISEDRFKYDFAADVFIGVPTMYEETMLASLEALYCGTPVILSVEADAAHINAEGAGCVMAYDREAMSQTARLIFADQEAHERSARRVGAMYSADKAVEALEALMTAGGRP